MQWFLRVVCIGYVIFLTQLLLSADPTELIGVHGHIPWALQTLLPAAHAISFFVLTVLALIPRWPVGHRGVIVVLASYGAITEIIQGFVPPRTPEWMDWFQDLGGIAAGIAVYWIARHLLSNVMQPNGDTGQTAPGSASESQILAETESLPKRDFS
jgi:hypothetical protein